MYLGPDILCNIHFKRAKSDETVVEYKTVCGLVYYSSFMFIFFLINL